MKHYFYFKKGMAVPQWLLRVRCNDVEVSGAVFTTNGRVMVDTSTGEAVIWPASKRMSAMITISNLVNAVVDAGTGYNSIYLFCRLMSPLALARSHGLQIRSTTRCELIPSEFQRKQ